MDDEASHLKESLEKSRLEQEASEKLKVKLVELESSVELLDHQLLKASEEITHLNTQVNSLTESLDAKEEEREKEIENKLLERRAFEWMTLIFFLSSLGLGYWVYRLKKA